MKGALKIFLIVLAVLIALRLAMEPVAEYYANKSLSNMESYTGKIRDIDIHLFRGAYQVKGITVQKVDSSKSDNKIPFVQIDTLDLSVQWDALFEGRVVGKVIIYRPDVNFISEKEGEQEQTGEETDWHKKLKELMPITINHFEIKDGNIRFLDPSVQPKVDISLKQLNLVAKNISNVSDSARDMPSSLSASATSTGGGELDLEMKMDFLQQIPEFDANLEFMSVDLTKFNDFIKAYGNFDVKQGTFSLITEMKVNDGQISGYIKPFFENLNILSLEQENKQDEGFFRKVWEGIVGLTTEIFENQPKERVATTVPIEGTLESPNPDVSLTIFNVFKNAFVEAIEKEFGRRAESS